MILEHWRLFYSQLADRTNVACQLGVQKIDNDLFSDPWNAVTKFFLNQSSCFEN